MMPYTCTALFEFNFSVYMCVYNVCVWGGGGCVWERGGGGGGSLTSLHMTNYAPVFSNSMKMMHFSDIWQHICFP